MVDIASFNLQNPWRSGRFVPIESFQRQLLRQTLDWLDAPDILVIIGSRQVGKTTLIFQIIEHLLADNIAKEDIFYFNLDDVSLLEFFKTPAEFVDFVELNQKGRAYIFIDEVQRLENPGLFLKYVYDLRRNLKFVVTASSSLEIHAKISESLTGRKKVFNLYPFSYAEFVATKWVDFPRIAEKLAINNLDSFVAAVAKVQSLYGTALMKWLEEYLTYGGYPRVALERDSQRKIAHLKEIFTSYLQKDVKDFLELRTLQPTITCSKCWRSRSAIL